MLDTQTVMDLLDDKRDDPERLRSTAHYLVEEGWRSQVNEWFRMDHNRQLAEQIGWRVRERVSS